MNSLILKQKSSFNSFIDNVDYNDITFLGELIINHKTDNIFLMGVGKSANIAKHISDLLKCISFKAFSLNLQDVTHGDSGCIKQSDVCIFFSNSGNTEEILNIVDSLDCRKILITSNKESLGKQKMHFTFVIPHTKELVDVISTIPTNSIINTISYFNMCIDYITTKTKITNDEYKKYHQSGNIGFLNKNIKDFVTDADVIISTVSISINSTINLLKKNKTGIITFVDGNNIFIGIITVKDILELYSNNTDKEDTIEKYINKHPICLTSDNSTIKDCINILKEHRFHKYLPVVKDRKFLGYVDLEKIFAKI